MWGKFFGIDQQGLNGDTILGPLFDMVSNPYSGMGGPGVRRTVMVFADSTRHTRISGHAIGNRHIGDCLRANWLDYCRDCCSVCARKTGRPEYCGRSAKIRLGSRLSEIQV